MEKRTITTGLLLPELQFDACTSMFGDVISPLYPTNAINASLLWRLPTGRAVYGGEAKQFQARMALQQTAIEKVKATVNAEVASTRAIILLAKEQMQAAQEGKELATKALSQAMERQRLGTVLPFELLQIQEVFIKSQLDQLNSVANHNKAQYRLFVAVGNNL